MQRAELIDLFLILTPHLHILARCCLFFFRQLELSVSKVHMQKFT